MSYCLPNLREENAKRRAAKAAAPGWRKRLRIFFAKAMSRPRSIAEPPDAADEHPKKAENGAA